MKKNKMKKNYLYALTKIIINTKNIKNYSKEIKTNSNSNYL